MDKKMGIILAIVIVILVILIGINVGWFDSSNSVSNASGRVSNNNTTLIVGFDENFPPFGYNNSSAGYEGFDLDLAQEVCNRNNWTLVKQPIDWDAKDYELNSGSIDCVWSGFTINGRENDYTWSDPYIETKQVVIVKSDSNIGSLADLKGKTVETQKGSSSLTALKGDNKTLTDTFKSLKEVSDYNDSISDLKSGKCDAVVVDMGVAQHYVNSENNTGQLKILNESISSEKYGVGFKLGCTDLRDQVQKTLDEMYADGTVAKIAEKYKDDGVPNSLVKK